MRTVYEFGKLLVCSSFVLTCQSALPQEPASTPQSVRQRPDIVRDNLEHVAAAPEPILEILNKEAGLMVELKQLLAEDAAVYGQILEETDLSDAAIAERLRNDLHARALATKLLRKYGYLVPRLNPESDMAAEHALELRERSQQIERARERQPIHAAGSPTVTAVACDLLNAEGCAPSPEQPATRGQPTSPAPLQPSQRSSPEQLLQASDQDTSLLPNDETPSLQLAELSLESTPSGDRRNPSGQPLNRPSTSFSELPNLNSAQSAEPATASRMLRQPAQRDPQHLFHEPATDRSTDVEALALNRKPNPYAALPSLRDLYVQAVPSNGKLQQFGKDVFRRGQANPELLPMDLPVGPDYVVGPGDSLSLNLWGSVSQRLIRVVDREGRVALPEVGAVLVSGRTLQEAQEQIEQALRTEFRRISADVSLLRLRTVRVYVVGEVVSPGAYDISSLSTPLNALFVAGGVTAVGSLRRLEHYRGKQLIEQVDAYELLLHGVRSDLKRLENGDSLRVPPSGPCASIDGMVRRPAMYELNKEKTLSQFLDLAGGLLPDATLSHIEVQRLQAHERRTMLGLEIDQVADKQALRSALEKFTIQDGDAVHIFPIAPYNTAVVYLDGHVLRPGRYSFREGMKFTDLVKSYDDLLPEPAGSYAEIVHISPPDLRPVVESFSLQAALANTESAPRLAPLDTVRIFSKYELEASPEILVTGEVRSPGRYRMSGQEHVRDAVYQAGGVMSDAWLESAQVFREQPEGLGSIFSIDLRAALQGAPGDNLLLAPGDHLLVHRRPLKVDLPSITIQGQVARPGRYPLAANMSVSQLIASAGGLLRSANLDTADLTHYPSNAVRSDSQTVDLAAALRGDPAADLRLRDGDALAIPLRSGWNDMGATVAIRGEVGKPGVYGIQPGERLSSLLKRAGGLLPTAYPQAAVFERTSVRELQQRSRQELIQRLEQESVTVKTSLVTSGSEEVALREAAAQQKQRTIDALRKAPVSGRLVVHLQTVRRSFAGSSDDIELRPGDTLEIPKRPGFVLIVGQVYNSNAVVFVPGKNAAWYLARAGGATQLANKKAIFVLRANGEVTSGTGAAWTGGALAASIGPGDTVVVPEKAALGSSAAWKNIVSIAQIAQGAALAAAVAIR